MKPRKWIIVLACFMLIVGGVLYGGAALLEKNRNIKRLLIRSISESTGSEFSAERVKIGFLSAYLENVTITRGTHFYHLSIHDIKVGFSLKNLVKYRGNVGRSISKIILVNPELAILVHNPKAPFPDTAALPQNRKDLFSAIKNLPVDQLLIRKGTVRLIEKGREELTIGKDLSGSIKADLSGVSFNLRGALAASRKNLFVSGFLYKETRRTRISLRLDQAFIQQSVRWKSIELRSGVLDGVCELSLPDSLTPETFESAGWFRIRDATARVDNIETPIAAVSLSVTLLNTRCRIDSMKCNWNGISIVGAGTWDVARANDSASAIALQCQGIRPESLLPKTAKNVFALVRGNGWGSIRLSKKSASHDKSLSIVGGGISVLGAPVLIVAKASMESDRLSIDSCTVRGPAVSAAFSGIVNYEKSPIAYSFSCSLKADSSAVFPALHGSGGFSMRGSLYGLGPKPRFRASIVGSRVRCFDMALGDPEISISGESIDHVAFECTQNNFPFFRLSGTIDSAQAALPNVKATVSVGPAIIRSALERNIPWIARMADSSKLEATFSGNAEAFEITGQATLYSQLVHGSLQCRINKNKKNPLISWRINQRELYAGDSLVSLSAIGTADSTAFNIDSLSAMGAVRGSGHIRSGAGGAELALAYHDLPLCALNTWVLHRRLPIKSGIVTGNTRISGMPGRISTYSELKIEGCSVYAFNNLETAAVLKSKDTVFTLLPTVIRKEGIPIISLDTVSNKNGLSFSGQFENIAIKPFFTGSALDDIVSGDSEIKGSLSGFFSSTKPGLPMLMHIGCPSITLNSWRLDSVRAEVAIDNKGVIVRQCFAADANRAHVIGSGILPWAFFTASRGDGGPTPDTMKMQIKVSGDLLASFEKNVSEPFHIPVAGTALGTIEIEMRGTPGAVRLYKAFGRTAQGTLRVKPYVQKDINDFSMIITMNEGALGRETDSSFSAPKVAIDINGTIEKRPIRICTSHKIPEGFEPMRFGFLDAGVVQVITPRRGVDLHLPGLMETGVTGDIEFAPKAPFPAFTLSGPIDRLRITGTWILHGGEFTFPPLKNNDTSAYFNPFPSITWNLDLKVINRKLKYFYDTGTKTRRLMRLVECYLDPISILSLRGCDKDNTFQVLGSIRSYKGSVFFRKVFDQNFEAGLDFLPRPQSNGKGYDNMPIIWGSAEAPSDKNRFDRIKLTLIISDSVTGALSEKGRFHDIRFRMSSDVDEMPGESEKAFLTNEGKRVASLEGAEELVSTLGEQYVHRFLLQNLEGRLAKSLGLDVITFETSIASNYFTKLYNRQLVNFTNDWSYLAFANVGITFGRYILYDKVFLKWRTELVPVDTLIRPEYTMGFEFQPLNYFMMDFDYGLRSGEKSIERNPKASMQLRLPIESIRNFFKF